MAGNAKAGKNCIEPECIPPYSSPHNGGSDRLNQQIKASIKVLSSSLVVTNNYWNFAFYHCVCLHNYLPKAGEKSSFKAFREVSGPVNADILYGCKMFSKNFFPSSMLVTRDIVGGGGKYLFSRNSVVDDTGGPDNGVENTNINFAYSSSDATILEEQEEKSRESSSDLELIEQNSEANSKLGDLRLLKTLSSSVDLFRIRRIFTFKQ